MVGMSGVNRISFPFTDVNRERLASIRYGRIIWFATVCNKIIEKWIGTGCGERRVGQTQDVVVGADRKTLSLPKQRILQLFFEFSEKIRSARVLSFKR